MGDEEKKRWHQLDAVTKSGMIYFGSEFITYLFMDCNYDVQNHTTFRPSATLVLEVLHVHMIGTGVHGHMSAETEQASSVI